MTRTDRGRSRLTLRRGLSALAASAVLAGALSAFALPAAAEPADPVGEPIPPSQYTLVGVDSESPAYPAPPAVDGTALGAFDDDYSTQWTVAYTGDGVATTPMPHWITLDVGGSFELTGIHYSVKNQKNGPVADVEVYATDDAGIAADPEADWGSPVGSGTFEQPASDDEVQTLAFDEPVSARYVKLVALSAVSGNDVASASEIRVVAAGDTTPDPVDPPPAEDAATPVAITNGAGLTVQVAEEFPQVISYDLDGATLAGRAGALDTFRIDGEDHVATTTMDAAGDTATYVSTFADIPGLSITSTLTATADDTVVFTMTELAGDAAASISEISIPDHSLVSVDSSDTASSLARTKISTDSTTTADQFLSITGSTAIDADPVGTPYGFVSDSELSAGIVTNATDDSEQSNNDNWNTRLQSQVVDAGDGARRAELSVGNWTYAPTGATDERVTVYALPTATVVLAADANGDGAVTWQDGAIAFRGAMTEPLGADRVADRVVQRIPFNFASQATNPFLKTLDNVKRVSMTTDDLGQWVLEKGYGSEGHDSAHPDYGGNYNIRAGGLDELNELTEAGAEYNADFAVHVNATEAYPQARNFSDVLVAGQGNGWNWLNQAVGIDQRGDLGSGAILDRFRQLREEAPYITTVYIDAYYSSGWLADALAAELREMGFEVATEWAYKFEGTSVWSHWANDKNYGGATNKGINSNIVRFIANGDRDVWNVDPVLGGSEIKDFEGWTGQDDWNAFYDTIWTSNLPTKFLQHFDVMSWDFGSSAQLSDGVGVEVVDGVRTITMDGVVVADGGTYLIPWQDADGNEPTSPLAADKMYYYDPDGGTTTFTLTDQFAGTTAFSLYELTDQGRVKVSDVTASGGRVTLTGEAGKPYVLAPAGSEAPHDDAAYGEGTGIDDPGFNAGDLDAWNATGGAAIVRTDNGDNVAVLGTDDSALSQEVTGLEPGQRYSFSANVEIEEGQRRSTTVSVSAGDDIVSNAFDITPAQNRVAADAKRDTYSQRASVSFTAPDSGAVTIAVGAVAGDAAVTVDDARVMEDTTAVADGADVVASDDFEGNQPGWGPFVKGDAGGTTDPRTSISELHDPYSQKAWKNENSPYDSGSLDALAVDDVLSGDHSLKVHEENDGLVFRTVPATVPFTAGHRYAISFDYQTNLDGQFSWITGADTVGGGSVSSAVIVNDPLEPSLETSRYEAEIVAGCGDTWVGLDRTGSASGADFVMDDLEIVDLGETPGGAACASVSAPPNADFSPGVPGEYVTTFTNNEPTDAENVGIELDAPEGWIVEVADEDGNLFDRVEPGETVSTTWILTPPADAAGTTAEIGVEATYLSDCVTKSVSTTGRASVSEVPMISPGSMTATADSENPGGAEGPASNVLDGDLGTIWHTDYTNATDEYPHWVTLALGSESEVDGLGFTGRQTGGQNGRVGDYTVSVSDDGESWTEVASGTLTNTTETQMISFDAVTASYVRFTALNALNGQPFAAAAEMRVYGSASELPTGFAPGERQDDEECGTPGSPAIDAPESVAAGGELRVELSGFPADADVTVTLNSDPLELGTVRTDADGAAVVEAAIPVGFATGEHVITAAVGGEVLAERGITVTAAGGTPPGQPGGPGAPGGPGGLPVTGAELAWLAAVALMLIVAGSAAVLARRRRFG